MGKYKDLLLEKDIRFEKKVDILNECFGYDHKVYQKAVKKLNDEYCVWVPRMAKGKNEPFSKKDKWINIIGDNYIKERRVDGKEIEFEKQPMKRIVFVKNVNTKTYDFTGVFVKDNSKSTKKESCYKRIQNDIRVDEWNKTQKILFCNLAYMREYNGIKEDDVPVNGGKYVELHHDALEKNNFSKSQIVKGFVETKYADGFVKAKKPKEIHIEKFDVALSKSEKIDGVKVIFVAKKPGVSGKVVVGYYDDATVYRQRQFCEKNGEKVQYNIETKKKNAHLIDENIREYLKAPLARLDDYGFGQSNIWYAGTTEEGRRFACDLIERIEHLSTTGIEELEDENYVRNVNEVLDELEFDGDKPIIKKETKRIGTSYKYPHDPRVGRIALNLADHKCEYDTTHETFTRKSRDEQYTEPHHLIPTSFHKEFKKDIDVPANIVSLCCNCHKKIHLGKDAKEMIEKIFKARKQRLKDAGIEVSLDRLLEMYNIKE